VVCGGFGRNDVWVRSTIPDGGVLEDMVRGCVLNRYGLERSRVVIERLKVAVNAAIAELLVGRVGLNRIFNESAVGFQTTVDLGLGRPEVARCEVESGLSAICKFPLPAPARLYLFGLAVKIQSRHLLEDLVTVKVRQ
jgi:hypothetical protein